MNCKHFDIDNSGNSICKLGGLCERPESCPNKEIAENASLK